MKQIEQRIVQEEGRGRGRGGGCRRKIYLSISRIKNGSIEKWFIDLLFD